MTKIPSSEITPEAVYLNRRQFMKVMGAAALGALLAACQSKSTPETLGVPGSGSSAGETPQPGQTLGLADELGDPLTTFEAVTTYNNFYEFSMDKEAVAKLAKDFQASPWTVTVGGLVNKPRIFGIEDLLKIEQEERIYRMRCVEGWSMVIPWLGFPIRKLLEVVEPLSSARYLRFEALLDEKALPGQRSGWFAWPYVEGLRLDEAMHDLAILSSGLYGKQLLPQNGAPVRLVVPWKYGFKSIKSIVRIDLVEEMPTSLWMEAAPNEYGFYANVNPEVPHPRWSQATERRIGELGRRDTLMFNGYADEVASLYTGMDLQKNY